MDEERLRKAIGAFAASPKNVHFQELVSLLDNHIGPMFRNFNHHHRSSHHAFTVGDQTFTVAQPKGAHVKPVYVKKFLRAMEALKLFEPED